MRYVASWSGGKDSTASIILAHEHGEPLDEIIFSEVMFDENISGEFPEHIEFVHECKKRFEMWGYKVTILRSNKTFMDVFMHIRKRGKHVGQKAGFPMAGRCEINSQLKIAPIKKYIKSNSDAVFYIGIAEDEPKRLARIKPNQISLLCKYGFTEQMAYKMCQKYEMLSPHYSFSTRGGVLVLPKCKRWSAPVFAKKS